MDWHRLFGLVLKDFFTGSPFTVEVELDLSFKSQLLDVVILRKEEGEYAGRLPDGLDNLTQHNLISFKSHQEALDDWALKELTGHYVNYRKQASPSMQRLLGEGDFQLYGVCARFPQSLSREVGLEEIQQGVYDCRRGTDRIRIIVTGQVPEQEHNAILHLFSASPARVKFGAAHYQQHSLDTSTLLRSLFDCYKVENVPMPYTMEDFRRDFIKEHRKELLEAMTPEERLKGLPPEERLKGLPPEERLKGLPPEERLKGLSAEEIEAYLGRWRWLVKKNASDEN
jgi:hypothetical protein